MKGVARFFLNRVQVMAQVVSQAGLYVGSAVVGIFSPHHDDFPATGAQSYRGSRGTKKDSTKKL